MSERIEDKLKLAGHLSMTVSRGGKTVGFNESKDRGRAAHGTIDEAGAASFGISGSPSHGEDGTLETSRLFVRALNAKGAVWSEPVLISANQADAVSCNLACTIELRMQAVRAVSETNVWKTLGRSGRIEFESTMLDQISALMKNSISLKAARIRPIDRTGLVLLLNALDTPIVCFDDPISSFLRGYGTWATDLGFLGIWVVGPWPSMVKSLTCAGEDRLVTHLRT